MQIHYVLKVPLCLKHSKKRTWIIDFIFSKVFFPYQMCTKCFQFFKNSSVLHMKGSMFPNHLKIFYKCALLDFDTWTCLIIIIVLNLWSWLKTKLYIWLLCHIWCENKKCSSCYGSYLISKLMFNLKNCVKKIIYIKFASSNSSWKSNLYEPLQYVQNGEYDLELRRWNLLHL